LTKAYLNYPVPHITLHHDANCREIQKNAKPNQRDVAFTRASFDKAIGLLVSGGFRLGADVSINDVWLTVDFDDAEFEEAVARYAHRLLGMRYAPLRGARVDRHC